MSLNSLEVPPIVEITQDIIAYSKSLSKDDLGRWGVVLKDSILLYDSPQEAYDFRDKFVVGQF